MEKICTRCLAIRRCIGGRNVIKMTQRYQPRSSLSVPSLNKTVLPSLSFVRNYAEKERQSEKVYKHGKLVVEEKEDLTVYPKFLMTLSSTDETVADSYLQFVRKAAKMVDVNVTKTFTLPALEEKYKAKQPDNEIHKEVEYILKRYQRVIEISDLAGDKSDVFLEFIQKSLPAGVQIEIELQRWEMLVDPNHPSLRIDK